MFLSCSPTLTSRLMLQPRLGTKNSGSEWFTPETGLQFLDDLPEAEFRRRGRLVLTRPSNNVHLYPVAKLADCFLTDGNLAQLEIYHTAPVEACKMQVVNSRENVCF